MRRRTTRALQPLEATRFPEVLEAVRALEPDAPAGVRVGHRTESTELFPMGLRLPLVSAAVAIASMTLRPGLVETADVQGQEDPSPELARYVEREDPAYGWKVRGEGRAAGARFTELRLTSQEWRGIPWRHQLFVIWPRNPDPEVTHGLLFIDGGCWAEELEEPGPRPEPPRRVRLFADVADALASPVAVLRQVPHQPLFDGLTEDALIAHTFQRYLETGDPDWPLLLPMVKSAARAMDAVEELVREEWGAELTGFTVTGASKRGWTTWLLGAVDSRATALAPVVIDLLDLDAHLDHQRETWGTFSPRIADYTERGLHEQVGTGAGQDLLSMVDPFRHRHRLTQPKLIVLGTNDPYWPLTALNLYWDELPGPRWVLYLPNRGHGAADEARLVGGIKALHRHSTGEAPLPEPAWEFEKGDGKLAVRVTTAPGRGRSPKPERVTAWIATAPTRDFREARWTSGSCRKKGGAYLCEVAVPEDGHVALFAELRFPSPDDLPLRLSTQIRIAGGAEGPGR